MQETNKPPRFVDETFLVVDNEVERNLRIMRFDHDVGNMTAVGKMQYCDLPFVIYSKGFVFCLGDYSLNGRIFEFDTFSRKSRELPRLIKPTRRTVAVASDHEIIIAGGEDMSGDQTVSCWVYATQTGSWTDFPKLNQKRWGHRMSWLNDGKVFVIGGFNGDAGNLSSVEVLQRPSNCNTSTQAWQNVAPMKNGRSWFGCTIVGTNILVAGGHCDLSKSVEIFEPPNVIINGDRGQWTTLTNLN